MAIEFVLETIRLVIIMKLMDVAVEKKPLSKWLYFFATLYLTYGTVILVLIFLAN